MLVAEAEPSSESSEDEDERGVEPAGALYGNMVSFSNLDTVLRKFKPRGGWFLQKLTYLLPSSTSSRLFESRGGAILGDLHTAAVCSLKDNAVVRGEAASTCLCFSSAVCVTRTDAMSGRDG